MCVFSFTFFSIMVCHRILNIVACVRVGACCLSILYIIVCICKSRTPSSLPLPPWQPQFCSLYLCLFLFHRRYVWKRSWCQERLRAGGEGGDRGWDGWMASPTQWTWIWASSGRWWRTGKPGMLQSMGSQRVGHDWATKLNWILLWAQVKTRNSKIIME